MLLSASETELKFPYDQPSIHSWFSSYSLPSAWQDSIIQWDRSFFYPVRQGLLAQMGFLEWGAGNKSSSLERLAEQVLSPTLGGIWVLANPNPERACILPRDSLLYPDIGCTYERPKPAMALGKPTRGWFFFLLMHSNSSWFPKWSSPLKKSQNPRRGWPKNQLICSVSQAVHLTWCLLRFILNKDSEYY